VTVEQSPDRARGYDQSVLLLKVHHDLGQRDVGMRAEILVGRERRRRWSVDDKLRIVREAFAPGARVALVARRREVSRSQTYQWRAQTGARHAGAAGPRRAHRRARQQQRRAGD
jgi:transposase